MTLTEQRLPVKSGARLPEVWQPRLRGVAVRSAAFVAAGTIAEILVRRMVRRALAPVTRGSKRKAARADVISLEDGGSNEAHVVSDTLLMRHIRIRR